MHAVFDLKAPKAQVDAILADPANDVVSRQSIAIRDGKALGFPDYGTLVLIEGAEAAMGRAAEVLGPLGKKLEAGPADAVRAAIKAQEDDAASGLGLIFG